MLRNELIQKINQSKIDINNYIKENNLSKNKLFDIILKILEGEVKEIQIVTNLYYIDNLNFKEISEVLEKDEITILNYFQLILFKIKLILDINEGDDNPYSVKNISKKQFNNEKGSLLDKKS